MLVYAGAVMVLFLFIIMLLDLRSERLAPQHRSVDRRRTRGLWSCRFAWEGSFVRAGIRFGEAASFPQISDVTAIGLMLFRYFNLPFQIVGVLLLVATVGVVVLSRGLK